MNRLVPMAIALAAVVTLDISGLAQPFTNEWRLDPVRIASHDETRQLQARVESEGSVNGLCKLTLDGWKGEALLEVTLGQDLSTITARGMGDTLILRESSRAHRMFTRQDGSFEWHIVLEAKPASERLAFGLHSRNLRFLYQGPLSESDLLAGAERPDSVIGSYAVYHATGRSNAKAVNGGALSYGTGKLCHIYRPRAWDSSGDTVWCELVVDTLADSLVVEAPKQFMEQSLYPVVIDPTFGCTDLGASNISLLTDAASANVLDCYTASAGDRIVSYHLSCYTYNSLRSVEMAAYSISGGEPNERLASPVVLTVQNDSPPQWYSSSSVSQPMIEGETYCVAVGAVSGSNVRAQYDTDPSARCDDNTAGGQLPAAWATSSTQDRRMSWYVTYETSGETDAVPMRRRRYLEPGR